MSPIRLHHEVTPPEIIVCTICGDHPKNCGCGAPFVTYIREDCIDDESYVIVDGIAKKLPKGWNRPTGGGGAVSVQMRPRLEKEVTPPEGG